MNIWFDENYYLDSKLTQLKLMGIKDVDNYEYSYQKLKEAIAFVSLTPEKDYLLFGREEGLNPNPYFNENEYLTSKLLSLQEDCKYKSEWINKSIDDLRTYMINVAHMTPIEHYTTIGWYETHYDGSLLNPSNIFNADEYFRNKLAHLQSNNYIDPQTGIEAKNFQVADIISIFKNQNIDPLTHFLLYGHSELISLPISTDRYEPNNSIEEATVLDGTSGFLKTLSIHHEATYDDEDYFKFILTTEGNKENFIGVNKTIPYYSLDLEI